MQHGCTGNDPTEIVFNYSKTLTINTGDFVKVSPIRGDTAINIQYYVGGGTDEAAPFAISLNNLASVVPDLVKRNWLLAQAGLPTEQAPPDPQAKAAAAASQQKMQNEVKKELQRHNGLGQTAERNAITHDLDGASAVSGTFLPEIHTVIYAANVGIAAFGGGLNVTMRQATGVANFAFETVKDTTEFVGRLANAPFETTYQTVVQLGKSAMPSLPTQASWARACSISPTRFMTPTRPKKSAASWPPKYSLHSPCLAVRRRMPPRNFRNSI